MSAAHTATFGRLAARSGSLWLSQPASNSTLSRMTSRRLRRYPKLRLSPSRALDLRLRTRTDLQRGAYRHAIQSAIQKRADRLPLLLMQVWLARQDTQNEPYIYSALRSISPSEWEDRFQSLASAGWSKEDLDHWIWILSGENGDVRVQRFVSAETPKPLFLLMLLVRSDEVFRKAESLLSVMEYASKHYFHSTSQSSGNDTALPHRTMTMDVSKFLLFLRRLVKHIMRFWPRAIVTVARFTATYIRGIPSGTDAKGYHRKCEVFNQALQLFKKPAAIRPVANMEFNWRAQRLLLAMSDNLDKPLVINKASYRAVRQVMVGLKKSKTERAVAVRYAKSWPPYRQDFDGLDAKRTPEDDHSRSVKAGILAKEAGYADDHYDQALGALGGMCAGSPTIQTRSLPPKEWKGDEQDRNLYTQWAMTVRATRNRQEAWKAFNDFASKTGKSPNFQVYAEMFIKLQARPLQPTSSSLPGDSRESFPIQDANYSEYELARLSPPSVAQLYEQMIIHGVKPEGHCLHTLLSNASSLEEGYRYLRDSGIDAASVSSVALFKEPSYQALRRMPLLVFRSYIQLLCALHPNRRGREKIPLEELSRIRHAIKLARLRLRVGTTEGSTFRPPWAIILRALARPHLCLLNDTQANNDAEALSVSMDIVDHVQKTVGIDTDMFMYLCRTVQKAAVSRLGSQESSGEGSAGETLLVPSAQAVARTIKTIFSQIIAPIGRTDIEIDSLNIPRLLHNIGPAHLHTYMRTLAFLEDMTAMKELLRWMLTHKRYIDKEAERIDTRGYALIAKTLCAFQAFAGPSLTQEEQEDMIYQMENAVETTGSWRWPTPEEVHNYVQSDLHGRSAQLQQRILARLWYTSSEQNDEEAIAMSSA
ncbi:hypothetical protein F5Y05DRAFT_339946 [Hypoxylon sp. FL0543]|nr:hypothetical protein F5Y05DRAFT_339946 [Hypoxylon sp. FL0543]